MTDVPEERWATQLSKTERSKMVQYRTDDGKASYCEGKVTEVKQQRTLWKI